jgi:hypothetical protein
MAVRTFWLKYLAVNTAPIGVRISISIDIRLGYIRALQADAGIVAVGTAKGDQTAGQSECSEHEFSN